MKGKTDKDELPNNSKIINLPIYLSSVTCFQLLKLCEDIGFLPFRKSERK